MRLRLVHVLHGDEPDAAERVVHHQQLFDPVLVQEPPRLVGADVAAHRDEVLPGHQLVDADGGVGREAHVTVGEDADEALGVAFDDGNAADAVASHQLAGVGEGLVGMDGDGVHHHAALELLDLTDLGGLLGDVEVLVNDAHAAGLRQRDGHRALGHRVHGGGDDRDVELDLARQPGAGVGLGGHHFGVSGHQQHVVEGEGFFDAGCGGAPVPDHRVGDGVGLYVRGHAGTFCTKGPPPSCRGPGP
jgi:hypothetical protein